MVALASWMYGDPAVVAERLEELRQHDAEMRKRARRKKARCIRKMVKLAKAREARGQR